MGCSNCGTGASGKPSGCKSNGGCSSGGCNRMNVHDWLSDLPLQDSAKPYSVIEVTFSEGSRKDFYRNNTGHILEKGDWIAVEGVGGYDIGQVSLQGELVKLQMKKYGVTDQPSIKRVLRPAGSEDMNSYRAQKEREPEVMIRSRAMSRAMKLDMKIAEVEMQADGKKATFFYTADQRVDFRELIKSFASEFRVKVEMKQIGARQESAKVGGIGSCGRELCCSTWLTDFKSVNTAAARYQNLSINQTKLSGQCGRLKCCLNYELDTYMDALSIFPTDAEVIETTQGRAFLQKRDIFKSLMWYSYGGSNKQYPMAIERVKEIAALNKQGVKPEELQAVELEVGGKVAKTVDMGYVNDVGSITLKSIEKNSRNKRHKGHNKPNQEARLKDGQPVVSSPQTPRPPKPQRNDRPQGPRPPRAEAVDGEKPQQPQGQKQQNANQQKQKQTQQRPPKPQHPNQNQNAPKTAQDSEGNATPNLPDAEGGQPTERRPSRNNRNRNRPPRPKPEGGENNTPASE